jgi:biopolymer transport protein ExbB
MLIGAWLIGSGSLLRAQTTGEDPATAAPQGLFQIIFAGGFFGACIMLLLLALSMTAAYLVFEHLLTIRRREVIPQGLDTQIQQQLAAGNVAEATRICQAEPSFLSYVLLQGLTEWDGSWPEVEKALEDALAEQSARLLRKIEYLSVIGNIAPMVGLLGTVTGMIFAFQRVAATQGAAGAGELAEGIYQALVTTVGGLLVAIPSLAAYAILRSRVDQLVAEAAHVVQQVCRPLKRVQLTSTSPPPVRTPRSRNS